MTSGYISLIVFIVLTIIYFITKYIFLTKNYSHIKIISTIYILGIIISQFILNVGLIKSICGNTNYGNAFLVTIIPWTLIFGLLYGALILFPGWKIPFSNTIGYLVTLLGGIRTLLVDNILKSNIKDKISNSSMLKAINHIYSDPSLLINEITPENFNNFLASMKKSGLLKSNVTDLSIKKFRNLVILKDIISEFIWFSLTGFLITSFSYNQVINQGCPMSLNEMKKRHDQYETDVKKEQNEKINSKPQRIYYSNY